MSVFRLRRGNLHLGRWLFNAAGAAALVFAVAALAFWARSHWMTDSLWVRCGSLTATVMTARNGCLFHWTGGHSNPYGRRWYHDSTAPSDMIRGNWGFWTGSQPHLLLGVITWGRAHYGGKTSREWGFSVLLPYWLLACAAAASAPALFMISRRLRGRTRRRAGQCARCGYDLRATPEQCPECGAIPRPPHHPLITFEEVIKHFGSRALRLKGVQRYLDCGGDVNRRDETMNWSLLHYAAEDCNPEIVRLLAARGADVNARDKDGWTPLHRAVESDLDAASQEGRRASELPTVQALIEHGADTTAKATDGMTPRDIAAAYGLEPLYDSVAQSEPG